VERSHLDGELRPAGCDGTHECASEVRLRAHRSRDHLEQGQDTGQGCRTSRRVFLNPALVLRHLHLERSQQQILLAAEAAVQGPESDVRMGCDVAQTHGLESPFLGELDCRLHDAPGPLFHGAMETRSMRPFQHRDLTPRIDPRGRGILQVGQ
jgi:hypothetical protein